MKIHEVKDRSNEILSKLGFKTNKRAKSDEQGNHYPLLYIKLQNTKTSCA